MVSNWKLVILSAAVELKIYIRPRELQAPGDISVVSNYTLQGINEAGICGSLLSSSSLLLRLEPYH
jgi:hypothetical protein